MTTKRPSRSNLLCGNEDRPSFSRTTGHRDTLPTTTVPVPRLKFSDLPPITYTGCTSLVSTNSTSSTINGTRLVLCLQYDFVVIHWVLIRVNNKLLILYCKNLPFFSCQPVRFRFKPGKVSYSTYNVLDGSMGLF